MTDNLKKMQCLVLVATILATLILTRPKKQDRLMSVSSAIKLDSGIKKNRRRCKK